MFIESLSCDFEEFLRLVLERVTSGFVSLVQALVFGPWCLPYQWRCMRLFSGARMWLFSSRCRQRRERLLE